MPPKVTEVELYGTPPSMNRMGARGHWRTFHTHKKQWEKDTWIALLAATGKREMSSPVSVSARLRFTSNRSRRDEGNYRALLEKAVGDALVAGGWIPDDTPVHYRFGRIDFDDYGRPPRTLLRFTELR